MSMAVTGLDYMKNNIGAHQKIAALLQIRSKLDNGKLGSSVGRGHLPDRSLVGAICVVKSVVKYWLGLYNNSMMDS